MFSISQALSVREQMKLSARTFETLLDLNDRPHLLMAVEIRGAHFLHLDSEAFVRIVDERGRGQRSWITWVADDGSAMTGYFATDAKLAGTTLEFGYGAEVFGRIDGFRPSLERLDRDRLAAETITVTADLIRKISKLRSKQDPLTVVPE